MPIIRWIGVMLFPPAFLASVVILITKTPLRLSSFAILFGLLALTWLLADVVSWVVHLTADKKFELDTPVFGAMIRPFREHHVDPQEMTRLPISKTLGVPALVGSPLQIAVGILAFTGTGSVWLLWFFTLLFGWTVATNLFHRWAHMAHPPLWIRLLQQGGIILPPSRHKLHHQTHNKSFAITSGITNKLWDKLFFSKFVDEQ